MKFEFLVQTKDHIDSEKLHVHTRVNALAHIFENLTECHMEVDTFIRKVRSG